MKLNSNLEDVSTGRKRPYFGGHEFTITGVRDFISKNGGNKTLQIDLDIVGGQFAGFFKDYPLRTYFAYSTDVGLKQFIRFLKDVQAANSGVLSEDDLSGDEFDESKLVGLRIGGVIKPNEDGYIRLHYTCSPERALEIGDLSDKYPRVEPQNKTGFEDDVTDNNNGPSFDDLVN